ncbi:hypothetical protein LEP1GSC050_1219 [Leptospira broomii serovar Hurstbridge str. 5399]|uniref:Uncharacterized protein n=3 Tax=Leptospira TaxID=171 RepID=V6HYP7_9LEPT|nr:MULTISPECIES: hypothetical protein [Leptospira]EQA38139.1 hypothetical protein LEP1GSC047_3896 [Leptospira inadai serovar Lyme str. 10]EQA43310.1 hypothetical protein LEP1GSC050_1219 [Leptospira broomii serovar Hurstbridge str. 5399]PNV76341.1 hypothetical protein BES34_004910 [Leptospira inadai serovar Lyme]
MKFEKGSEKNPSGNLIVYCNVVGENPLYPGGKIIASNVVVSFLRIGENFPVVTFPPVSLDSYDDLKRIISDNYDKYDVVKIKDFEMPTEQEDSNSYIKERMDHFENVVIRYVELCKNREGNSFPANDKEPEGVRDYLDSLANLSLKVRRSSGIAREASLLHMEKLVENFAGKHPEFDLHNFRKALEMPGQTGEELIGLYLQKFNAISYERYEDASSLNKRIQQIESVNS